MSLGKPEEWFAVNSTRPSAVFLQAAAFIERSVVGEMRFLESFWAHLS